MSKQAVSLQQPCDSSPAPVRVFLEQSLRAARTPAKWGPLRSMLGSMLLLGIAACAAAAPAQLPQLFLFLATLGLPWRILSFFQRKWAFFLIDYCYVANALVIAFLLGAHSLTAPSHAHWLAALYSLSEGPLASALIMWQCAWAPGSVDHVTSVLLHLLPGLVLFTMRHSGPPAQPAGLGLPWGWGEAVTWHLGVPTAVYLTWQALYFLLVQVGCRSFIQAGGYDTSYKALSRRAGRSNSYLHRLGRRGGVARRLGIFGALQLVFTLATFLVGIATYYSKTLAVGWQVVKLCAPLYFGARAAELQAAKSSEALVRQTLGRLAQQGWAHADFVLPLGAPETTTAGASAGPKPSSMLQSKPRPHAVVHASCEGGQAAPASPRDRLPAAAAGSSGSARTSNSLSRRQSKVTQAAQASRPRSGPRLKSSF